MRRHAFALPLPALLTACAGSMALSDQMPIDRVVLYQSGVAYVERSGAVDGGELTMQVRPDQINDILASLVVIDNEGGGGVGISMPIDRGAAEALADLPIEVRQQGGIYSLLWAFRGAEVVVRTGADRVRGRIVGVESGESGPQVTLLASGDRLVPVAIDEISAVRLANESLAIGLDRSLDSSLSEGDWKPVDVTIRFADAGSRDVTMAYMVEMPIWKTTYRAVVDDGGVLLQGWAVVDNVSGEDWSDVDLSLTAGTPISFRYDLHTPVYIQRPDMTGYGVPTSLALAPPPVIDSVVTRSTVAPSGGYGMPAAAAPMPAAEGWGAGRGEVATGDAYYAYEMDDQERAQSFTQGFAAAAGQSASVSELAALFRYDVREPVTVPDQSSSLVTLINTRIDGEDALVFQDPWSSSVTPHRALLFSNDTGYPIQPAPLTIYRDATFIGSGVTPSIAPGEEGFVPYSVESRVRLTRNRSALSGDVRLTRIVDGQIFVESQSIQTEVVTLASSLDEAETAYVAVPRYSDHEFVDMPEGTQNHESYYLVPVEVAPAEDDQVSEFSQVRNTLTNIDVYDSRMPDVLAVYLSNPDARPDVVEALRPVRASLAELSELGRQASDITNMRTEIQRRTNELRQNIQTLGTSDTGRELRADLEERLAEAQDAFDRLSVELVELNEQQSALRTLVSEQIRSISLNDE